MRAAACCFCFLLVGSFVDRVMFVDASVGTTMIMTQHLSDSTSILFDDSQLFSVSICFKSVTRGLETKYTFKLDTHFGCINMLTCATYAPLFLNRRSTKLPSSAACRRRRRRCRRRCCFCCRRHRCCWTDKLPKSHRNARA